MCLRRGHLEQVVTIVQLLYIPEFFLQSAHTPHQVVFNVQIAGCNMFLSMCFNIFPNR